MRSDNGVFGLNRVTTGNASTVETGVYLLDAGVHGLQSVEALLEGWRQALVCLHHVGEQGISAGRGAVEDIQEGCSGGLLLERDV